MSLVDENKNTYIRLKRKLDEAKQNHEKHEKAAERWCGEVIKYTKLISPFRELYEKN